MRHVDYLIVGAGLTGLGAAHRLKKYGISSFVVLEADDRVGGISSSFKDDAGFTWDLGGHVLFSKDRRFVQYIDDTLGSDLFMHQRSAKVNVDGQWTGYPFQDNIHQLSPELAKICQDGLSKAPGPSEQTRSFKDWIYHTFGDGICQLFMEPYNRKMWTVSLEKMGFHWIGDRVSIGLTKQLESSKQGLSANKWGPNSEFRYPRFGGIGNITDKIATSLSDHIWLRHEVVMIDPKERVATIKEIGTYKYKALLSTVPLDLLISKMIRPKQKDILTAAAQLKHNRVIVVGIGLDIDGDRETSWMYFPDSECPFYRLTHLHNYSPSITPNGQGQAALMAEVAFSQEQSENESSLVSDVINGLSTNGIVDRSDEDKIVSTWCKRIPYAYPIPTLDRDQALVVIQSFLEKYDIYSRGRFGGWKYEVGNMDHSFMQGFEWAERIVEGKEERIYSILS